MQKRTHCSVAAEVFAFLVMLLSAGSACAKQGSPTRDLMLAVARCDVAPIPILVAQGADPNAALDPVKGEVGAPDSDFRFSTALTISVYCGNIDTTRALLSAGAKPKLMDLYFAIQLSQLEIARVLLDATTLADGEANTPIIPTLAMRNSLEVSTIFRQQMVSQILTGQKQDAKGGVTWEQMIAVPFVSDPADGIFLLLDSLVARGFRVDEPNDGKTAREIASTHGDVLLARGLASRGAVLPLGLTDQREREVQMVGAATNGNLAGVVLLLSEGVSPNATNLGGDYALPAAIARRNTEITAKLLDAGVDPKLFGSEQSSALSSAAKLDQAALIARLVDKGANANQCDGSGSFPLMSAARQGSAKAIAALLAHGASAGFVDPQRRTALHYLIDPEIKSLFSSSNRPITPAHLEAVRLLTAASLPLDSLDENGNSVLASNFGSEHPNLDLIQQLIDSGARATLADLDSAFASRSPGLLRTLLRKSPPPPLPESLLFHAASQLDEEPDLAVAILEYGVEIPTVASQQRELLREAARAPSESALGLLLARGLPLSIDTEGKALEAALYYGRPKSVVLLASRGANLQAKDWSGRTALHRFIADDARGSWPTRIQQMERAAITALVDAGFKLDAADNDGQTAGALAQAKPGTLAAFGQAVAAAGANSAGIHAAIRGGRLDEIRRLAGDHSLREARDTLGRTPLSFALQSQNWSAARILLRAGAVITLFATDAWQPSDTSFASERAISGAFAVRLLTPTLVAIPKDSSPSGLQAARQAYQTGRAMPFDDFTWRLKCEASATRCGDGILVAGNKSFFYDLLESSRFDRGAKASFGLVQRNIRSIHLSTNINLGSLGGPASFDFGEITFLLTGAVTIQSCNFAFENPSCSPGVRIHNPNVASGLSLLTDTGYEKLPIATLRYSQPNSASGSLAPDESIVLDRSAGPITLEIDEVRARVFALNVELERIEGESVDPLPLDPSVANRMKFYGRLAQLHARRSAMPSSTAERAADKTLASTINAVSAEAYFANYPTIVWALLRQQADVVANLDLQVRSIQNAVLAQATYTPGQIDALVAQIDAAMAIPTASNSDVLSTIRAELLRLRSSVDASGVAVNELRNTLFTDADLYIELYQALVLEYRQFVPSSALDTALDPNVRQAIAARISAREVLISDAAADGMGKALRVSFGLPDPLP